MVVTLDEKSLQRSIYLRFSDAVNKDKKLAILSYRQSYRESKSKLPIDDKRVLEVEPQHTSGESERMEELCRGRGLGIEREFALLFCT